MSDEELNKKLKDIYNNIDDNGSTLAIFIVVGFIVTLMFMLFLRK